MIMVADDDPAIVDSLTMLLEESDYAVRSTVDGKVYPMMKEMRPDLLLLDIWMSGIDGREICKKIKADKEISMTPVILISASKDIAKSSRDAGADGFIAKPFDISELLMTIEKHLD